MTRFLVCLLALLLTSCTMRVQKAALQETRALSNKTVWPTWTPSTFARDVPDGPYMPTFKAVPGGEIVTYGPGPDGCESFAIISKREQIEIPGIFPLRQCFLPTSIFAGPSPLKPNVNELLSHDRKWLYSAFDFRSTFFELQPALTSRPKGLLVYHTSIMLLSIAEKKVMDRFRKLGWHVLICLPPDSLYRLKVPAQSSTKGNLSRAADLVAHDMDRHYLEQARSTQIALRYLAKAHPQVLLGQKILMGTSAGTFGLPAEALMNPGWDALIFVSGGSNLLSLYASGSAGLFKGSMAWVADARANPPAGVTHVFSDEDYLRIYRLASERTGFHAQALAPRLRDHRILMIAGTIDHIMPDDQALGLYHALGRPERWTAPLGHHLIALQLILEVDRIDRWITHRSQLKANLEDQPRRD